MFGYLFNRDAYLAKFQKGMREEMTLQEFFKTTVLAKTDPKSGIFSVNSNPSPTGRREVVRSVSFDSINPITSAGAGDSSIYNSTGNL